MNILDQIVTAKHTEVARDKKARPVKTLESSPLFQRNTLSLRQALTAPDSYGIIAEFKRRSPSKGIINDTAGLAATTKAYAEAGASALSVLTNTLFFGGSKEDLRLARLHNACPILCKEFIVDEYQVIEARALGADAILLIASILSCKAVNRLAALSASLGMEVLLEVHSVEELDHIQEHIDLVGINNRNLKTFTTDTKVSLAMGALIPAGLAKISESGISDPETALNLQQAGFDGFLIGEQFMKNSNPGTACASFINSLNQLKNAG